jgi:hypothetical protein
LASLKRFQITGDSSSPLRRTKTTRRLLQALSSDMKTSISVSFKGELTFIPWWPAGFAGINLYAGSHWVALSST